jgi:molecular chaperone GrpE
MSKDNLSNESDEEILEEAESEEVVKENGTDEEISSVPLDQYEKIKDDYLRLAADFDNFKKRSEKERENITKASVSYFINGLMPLLDNFEIATSQEETPKEVETLNSLLEKVLSDMQIEQIGNDGEDFDPSIHEAVEHSGEGDKQVVDTVLRKGYKFQDSLIRPAMVKVKSE